MGVDKQPGGAVIASFKSEYPRQDMVGQMTREMSISEIHSEQKEFANSCQLALKSGFDIIEIHAPHGYLEHSFLSPAINKRTDMYGGDWRNRKRFLNETFIPPWNKCLKCPIHLKNGGQKCQKLRFI